MRGIGKAAAVIAATLTASASSFAAAATAKPQPATSSGAFTVERPTLVSLGFEWRIGCDDNRNARVDVSYRRRGESAWRQGLPLLRLDGEVVSGGRPRNSDWGRFFDYVAPDMFAGSLLNLEPDAAYEVRLRLIDPDGVSGPAVKVVTVRTRKPPQAAAAPGGRVFHVYPWGWTGPKQQPAYTGLLAAYYMGSDESDHSNAFPPRVRPGDVIEIHAGVYKDRRFVYGGFDPKFGGYGTPFDGTYYLTASGTPERPIVIKAAGDGEVIFDGDGNQTLFNLMGANYNLFEGITVRNTNVAFLVGLKDIAGSSGFSLMRSRLVDVGRGVQDEWAGSKDVYIADNVFIGRHDRQRLQTWFHPEIWAKFPGYPAPINSEYAVKVYGQGHVVAYNYVEAFHDGIDVATYGTPKPEEEPSSIDFYGNDVTNTDDNCFEADGSAHNVRVFRNRCFNSTGGALSAQPIFGGPAYFFQNLVYNTTTGGPLKFVDTPAGVLVYQNTFFGQSALFGPAANVHFRNNLWIGDGWRGALFAPVTSTRYSTADYDGFRPGPGPGAAAPFGWTSPAAGLKADYKSPLVKQSFATLDAFRAATGQERHGVLLGDDVFVHAPLPDASDPQRLYRPEDFDFRLKPGSAAIDKGVRLPTINDGYAGSAPDLGAYELGSEPPHYGPRVWPTGSSPGSP